MTSSAAEDLRSSAPAGPGPAPPTGAASDRKPRRAVPFILIAGMAIGAGVFAYWWMYMRGIVSTDDAQIEGHIHEVSPRVMGTVLKVLVDDNQEVKAGQLLVELDPRDFEVIVAQQKAELAAARALAGSARTNVAVTDKNSTSNIDQAKALVTLAETNLASGQKQVEQAQADLDTKEAECKAALDAFTIKEQMFSKSAASKLDLIMATDLRDTAKAQIAGAKAGLDVKVAQVAQARAGILYAQAKLEGTEAGPLQVAAAKDQANQADATVQKAEAALSQAELNLSYTKMYAPVDGVVSKKTAETGAHLSAGQPIMAVVELANSWVVANFKETQITHMKSGQKVEITVDAYPKRTFRGVVDSIAAGTGARFSLLPPENATGNYVKVVQRIPVKIVVDRSAKDAPPLRPGMNVIATVDVGR